MKAKAKSLSQLRAGVVGTGFIGRVHIEALKRLGLAVQAVYGSGSAGRVAEEWGIPGVFARDQWEAFVNHPEIDVIHITSPNRHHFAQAAAALRAGKHVVCEKPLAMTTAETGELVRVCAEHGEQVFAVNYNVRFYPAVLQLRADVAAGRLGRILHVNGSYMQDWLVKPTDYNWRLLPEEGGELRAVGDIGTHWLDAVTFILGSKAQSVFANLTTCHTTRQRPLGEVETFHDAGDIPMVPYEVKTEDFANILLQFGNGAAGNLAVSQVANGRKNCIRIEIYGTERSAWWDSESPNTIHYGSRTGANAEALRACPEFMDAHGYTDYPPGHAEGFPDTFKMLFRSVYSEIAGAGKPERWYAGVADGHHELELCEAIQRSHRTRQWEQI